MEPRGGTPFVWAIFTLGVEIAFFHLFCCSPYNRRNTLLRCGNPRSFTQSKLPRVFLARLVLLGSKTSKERSSICLLLRRLIGGKLPRVFLARLVLLGSKTGKERFSICLLLRRLNGWG